MGTKFLCSAYKKLKPHKEFLEEMASAKKSKDAYIALRTGMFQESKDPAVYQVRRDDNTSPGKSNTLEILMLGPFYRGPCSV